MHTRWHRMHPSPPEREMRWRFATRSKPDALARGGVRGADARRSAGCAGSVGDAECRLPEGIR